MQEAVVRARDHVTAIHADAGHLKRRPDRVAGEELVVRRDAGKLHHAELQRQMIDELLCLRLCQRSLREVAADVDVEERGDAADTHGGAILRLDGCQIAEVEPLDGLFGILGRIRDVVAVGLGHLLHLLQGPDLLGELLALADDVVRHDTAAAVCEVLTLLLDEEIDAVERHAAIIADDAAASVRVRQARDDMAVTRPAHLRRVGIEDRLVVGLVVLRKDLVEFGIDLVAVRLGGLFRHPDAAERHERALQGLVRLQADDLLEVLQRCIDVARAVRRDTRDDFRLAVQDTAPLPLFLLQLLHPAPELVSRLRRANEEVLVTVIRRVVVLDEISYIDIICPLYTLEASPCSISIHAVHRISSFFQTSMHVCVYAYFCFSLIYIIPFFARPVLDSNQRIMPGITLSLGPLLQTAPRISRACCTSSSEGGCTSRS